MSEYLEIKSIVLKQLGNLMSLGRIKSKAELPAVFSSVNRNLKGLKECNENPDNWGTIISYFVLDRLDEKTYEDFENQTTDRSKLPSWKT